MTSVQSAAWFPADGLGSITRMTDASEGVVRSHTYDAFGRITSESGALANRYAFTGREWDSSREPYHYRARSYDPEVGRFLQKDPAGMADGPNLYLYVGNNPVNRVDPSGRSHNAAEVISPAALAFNCMFFVAVVVYGIFGAMLDSSTKTVVQGRYGEPFGIFHWWLVYAYLVWGIALMCGWAFALLWQAQTHAHDRLDRLSTPIPT